MQDGGRIQPAAQPDAQRNVGDQVFLDRLCKQTIQLFGSGIEAAMSGLCLGKGPEGFRPHLAVLPLDPRSRQHLTYAFDHGPGCGNVVEREVAIERGQAEAALNFGMDEDGLQLGAEVEVVAAMCDVERLDADAVPGQNQPPVGVGPDGDGEHAAQPLEARGVPFQECVENGFSVAMGMKAMSGFFELGADLKMVVDLAVEDDGGVAVITL